MISLSCSPQYGFSRDRALRRCGALMVPGLTRVREARCRASEHEHIQQNALHVVQAACYDRAFLTEPPRSSRKAQVRDLRRGPHRRERFNDLIPRQMAGERRDTHPRPCRPARALAAAAARDTWSPLRRLREMHVFATTALSARTGARARAAPRPAIMRPPVQPLGRTTRCRCSASLLRDVIPASHIINHTINHSIP